MQTLISDYVRLCEVKLPYKGRQKYMYTFHLANPTMPEGFEDYLDIVSELCATVKAHEGFAHMTVDEKEVKAGTSQRRPKPHVDGCFVLEIPKLSEGVYTGGSWTHRSWLHYCNNIRVGHVSRMPVIIASSYPACKAWHGTFIGDPAEDGDLSHIADQLDDGKVLESNVAYLLSPDCVHESMILKEDVKRTFLRIALPIDQWAKFWGSA